MASLGLGALHKVLSWTLVKSAFKVLYAAGAKVVWVFVGFLVLALVVRDFTADVLRIAPISVPKSFSDNGYTPEVASQRLRDEISKFGRNIGSSMQSPNLALQSELPKISVPKVDISLDTITSLVRGFFSYGDSRHISGEFVSHENRVRLRLRFNGKEIYTSANGVDPAECDKLLAEAVPAVIQEIQPYLIASAMYSHDPEQAVQVADGIIVRLPESDVNVQWSMVLKGKYYLDHKEPSEAEALLRKSISLNFNNAAAHVNLGIALREQGKLVDAVTEYRSALRIDPGYARAHNNLGVALNELGATLKDKDKVEEAIAEYRRAIGFDLTLAAAHTNLGNALKNQGRNDEAVTEYRRALRISPNEAGVHNNLGVALKGLGKIDEAIAEFQLAVDFDTKSAVAHDNLGDVLRHAGKTEEAIAEYYKAIASDPKYAAAHDNLGNALKDEGKIDEAIIEYERALAIDPKDEIARINIERIKLETAERKLTQTDEVQSTRAK
jgi:tetratricopeptide (TPR) repeat protein